MMTVLSVTNLTKSFKGLSKPAIDHLSLSIDAGVITGLVGPDGAGKTTLIRMLAGLLTPDDGAISLLGLDPIQESAQLRPHLGYMPQKFGLYEDLTVLENLNLYADLRGVMGEEKAARLTMLLNFTDLAAFTERLAGKLSGGMKQKLGLACTLIGNPKILLLDEPSVGVDPIARRELWKMVHQLASDGMLVLWSTSYLDEAEACDQVFLLNQGKIIFSGKPQMLTRTMEGRVWLAKIPQNNKRVLLQKALLSPEITDGVIQGRYLRLIMKKQHNIQHLLKDALFAHTQFLPTPARFEDAFIDLLGGMQAKQSVLSDILSQMATNSKETVIEARELTKTFGNFNATDHVSFTVKRGEIFGLLGPNGAGKSTTFKMMCALMKPTSGKALVLNIDLKKGAHRARQYLGYMAQKFSLYGHLDILQNLKFFSGIYGLTGQKQDTKISEMVHAFGLETLLTQKTNDLPLGYKQRLALACALMHEPQILFLDEPTSGVDPLTRREFWLHINGMVDKGVTVMVTTHFMDEAEYCDRIGLVYRGKIIAAGTPDQLKESITTEKNSNPTMEDAFIELVQRYDQQI